LSENDQGLLTAASLQFQWWKICRNLQFFALVENVSGDSHGVIVLAEVGGIDIINLKQILDEAK
jgi:hypothetical protein